MRTAFKEIQPGDQQNLHYWTKKWGVTPEKIGEAIISTGSLNPDQIRTYLTRDSWIHHPIDLSMKVLKKTYQSISE